MRSYGVPSAKGPKRSAVPLRLPNRYVSDRRPHRRGHPQAGRGGESADAGPVLEDGAAPQEPDTDHDLRGDPGHVGLDGPLRPLAHDRLEAVGRDDGEQRRPQPHQDVSAEPGRLLRELALPTEGAGQRRGEQQAEDQLALRWHGRIIPHR